mmetsp:Transcript_7419/g.16971  ORF Transcript_7419/g.16971 Transcript_7419/m.16971 type:complete len:897 (+) Transcript_7419:48-2738(+)
MPKDSRLEDCLKRVSEAERSLSTAREVLSQLCSESERRPPPPPAATGNSVSTSASSQRLEPERTRTAELGAIQTHDLTKCRDVFDAADKDKSGLINKSEVKKLLEKVTGHPISAVELQKIMQEDENYDGQLNFDEFVLAFCSTREQREAHRQGQLHELGKDSKAIMDEAKSAEDVVQSDGVLKSAVLRYLRKELDETSACLQLPQALLIFVFFALSVTLHFKTESLHGVDTAITWDIRENANFAFVGVTPFENGRMGHKSLEDVNSIADFWSWFNLGLVPIFWPQGWDVNEVRTNVYTDCWSKKMALRTYGWNNTLLGNVSNQGAWNMDCNTMHEAVEFPEDVKDFFGKPALDGRYLLHNSIVAGARLRQERAEVGECGPFSVRSLYEGTCIDAVRYWLKPELHQGLRTDQERVDQTGGETVHLLSRSNQNQIRSKLEDLENRAWFGPHTLKIEIMFTTYNAKEDMVTATYVNLFMNTGGHIHKWVEPVSFYIHPYHGWWCWASDGIWLALIAKLFIEETIEILKHIRQLGCGTGLKTYMSFANAVDWISILYAFGLVGFWLMHLDRLAKMSRLMESGDTTVPGTWVSRADRDLWFSMCDQQVEDTHNFRSLLSVYPFIIVGRFFKAFSSQPRLAMVTKTLGKASVDITHFGVVFATVFIVFATSAQILWGQELKDYANVGRSVHSTFRMMLGDFDWEPMYSVGRPQAYLWFWCFMWLVNLTMLNMLLAIIMDVYTDVKGSIGSGAETLWSQTIEILHRWRLVHSGRAVALSKVLKALDPTDLDEDDEEAEDVSVTVDSLCEAVPDLRHHQSLQILVASQELYMAEMRPSDSLTDATLKIQRIDRRVMQLQQIMDRFIRVHAHTALHGGGGGQAGGYGTHVYSDREGQKRIPSITI